MDRLDKFDFSRRMAFERDVDKNFEQPNLEMSNISI